ncbi:MAG: M20/M25/M40 family metallo-hydrolase [Elusimicrobia bacterium]|nr:M20/M25/M40 family metallo-hydrolase [Elusimicrobiota bacterium]
MNTRSLSVALLLSALSPARALDADFPPTIVPPAAADLWVSFDKTDLAKPEAAEFPLSGPVLSDERTAVYKVRAEMLPLLSQFMHERFNRCGGYLTHDTMTAARASMRPTAAVPRIAYTLDQQATVAPLVAGVREENIRGVISAMAAHNNRYYASPTGVEAARWLRGRWSELAAKIPGASAELFAHASWKQPSVILAIPGSENPEEIVVLGGHLDSINGWGNSAARAPGADDNASGIAVLTEAARILAESGYRPKRTIQFIGYAAEEVGLRGSQEIAAKYASGGKKVVGVIQYDMSNFAGSGEGIFLLTDYVDPALSAFTARLIDAYAGVKSYTTKCGYGCSDHASWTKKGFPAAMAFEATFDGSNPAIHSERDTLASSGGDASHSVPFAKLAVAFAVELAKTAPPAGTN